MKALKKSISILMVIAMIVTTITGVNLVNGTKEVSAKESAAYTIKVNLGTNCTTIYNSRGKAIKAMICSPSNETPVGTFYVPVKYRWHEMIGNCYAQYCTRITEGILFHSVWYYKNGDKSTMSVSAYNVMGQKASHGCVRLLCKDAKWIYDHCAVGTKVVTFWGSKKDDPLPRPSFTPIRNGKFTDWDPTDPDPANPYRKAVPKISADTTKVEYGKKVSPLDLVTIKDSAGNVLTKKNATIKVKGKINTKKIGKYKVKFTVKDSIGNTKSKTITFSVVDTKKPVITGAKSKKNIAMGTSENLKKGVTAKMKSGKRLTSKIQTYVKYNNRSVKAKNGTYRFTKAGTYKVTYKVRGTNKLVASKTVTYKVVDKRVKFALNTSAVTIKQGEAFDPYSYVKTLKNYKNADLNVKNNITIKGDVDTSVPGTYTITYTATYNKKSYTAKTATLKVTVEKAEEETTQPETPGETTPEETTTAAE